jgi:hypothetical protein
MCDMMFSTVDRKTADVTKFSYLIELAVYEMRIHTSKHHNHDAQPS